MSLSRTIQYAFIAIVTLTVGFSLYQWNQSRAAQTLLTNTSSARPDFEAPLLTDLNLTWGNGTATYSRADGADRWATVTDFEGLIRPVKNGEARFTGARRVENLVTYSEDQMNGAWVKSRLTDSAGGIAYNYNVTKLTLTGGLGIHQVSHSYTETDNAVVWSSAYVDVSNLTTKMAIIQDMRRDSTYAKVVFTWTSPTTITTSAPLNLLNYGYKVVGNYQAIIYAKYNVMSGASSMQLLMFGAWGAYNGDGEYVFVSRAMVEDVTGQAIQNPSEYVSTNVKTIAPYHGANVDGVKYFATQNGNVVASNVVTEAVGVVIPDATLKGYLAEGSRINLALQNESVDDASWVKNDSTITANSIAAPSGRTTADLVTEGSGGGAAVVQSVTVVAATNYTLSVYLKAGNYDWTRVVLYQLSNTTNQFRVWVNLTTGVIGTANASGTATYVGSSIQSVGNGWYRVSVTGTLPGTDGQAGTISATADASGTRVSGGTRYVWGAQLEAALFASSYIPTTTVSVTRASDSLAYPLLGNSNDTSGTLAADVTPNWTGGSGYTAYFLDHSLALQRFSLWHWGGSVNHLGIDRSGNGATRNHADYGGTAITNGTMMHIAGNYDSTIVKLYLNGAMVGSTASPVLPFDATGSGSLLVGRDFSANGSFASIKNARIWKQAMSDTFINNLTSVKSGTIKQSNIKSSSTGLVGYWPLDDGTGALATDASGNTSTGTLTNSPAWASGRLGKALNFTAASSQYVVMGNVASLKNVVFTYAAWINPSSLAASMTFLSGGAVGTPRIRVDVGSGQVDLVNSGVVVMATSTGAVPINTWTHVAVTYDALGNYVFYINGVASGSGTSLQSWNFASASFEIGRNGAGLNEYFSGLIDDPRMYNRVLTSAEVANLSALGAVKVNTSQNANLTSGLVGLWSFNGPDLSGTTAYDRSGSSNNGTLTNGPTITEGKVGQALSFDGVNDWVSATSVPVDTSAGGKNTVAFWMKYTAGTNNMLFIWAGANYDLYINGGCFGFNTYNAGDTLGINYAPPAGVWTHVVAVFYNGVPSITQNELYINGIKQTLSACSGTPISRTVGMAVGIGGPGAVYAFNGSLDEVRIYNRVLSSTEVAALYNSGR